MSSVSDQGQLCAVRRCGSSFSDGQDLPFACPTRPRRSRRCTILSTRDPASAVSRSSQGWIRIGHWCRDARALLPTPAGSWGTGCRSISMRFGPQARTWSRDVANYFGTCPANRNRNRGQSGLTSAIFVAGRWPRSVCSQGGSLLEAERTPRW